MNKRDEANTPEHDAALVQRATPAFAVVPAAALLDRRLTNAQRYVFSMMCLHANAQHICWPKLDTLATEIGISKQAVSRTIHDLIKLGYVTARKQGFPARNIYRIAFDVRAPDTAEQPPEGQSQPVVDTAEMSMPTVNTTLTQSQHHVDQQSTSEVDCITDHRTNHKNILLARSAPDHPAREDGRADRAQKKMFDQETMKRDPLYGAFVRALNYEPQTRQAWDEWRVGINELNHLQATPQDVYRAVKAFYDRFPHATCTVRATVKWWAALKEGKSHDIAKLEASQRASEISRAEERQRIEQQQRDADRLRAELERDIANGVL